MVDVKAARKNLQMLTPSKIVGWSRVEKNSTSILTNKMPMATSPRFFQGRQEPLDRSRLKTMTVMGGGSSNKWPIYNNATRSIHIKKSNAYRINLAEFEPTLSRTIKPEGKFAQAKTFGGTASDTKSRSCSKQKITLSNKAKCMNFPDEDRSKGSWFDPIFSLISGAAATEDGCTCEQPCRWASEFVRWSLAESPRDRSKYY